MQLKCKCPSIKWTMKVARLLSLLFLLTCFSMKTMAQEKRFSITFSNEKASSAFRRIESLSDYKIQFNYKDVDFSVTLDAKQKTVPEIVKLVIAGHSLKMEQKGKYLAIVKEASKWMGG